MSNPGLHYRPSPQFVTAEPKPSRWLMALEIAWTLLTAALALVVVPFLVMFVWGVW